MAPSRGQLFGPFYGPALQPVVNHLERFSSLVMAHEAKLPEGFGSWEVGRADPRPPGCQIRSSRLAGCNAQRSIVSVPNSSGKAEDTSGRRVLADLIEACKDEIVARWTACVAPGSGVGIAQLQDAVPDYLNRLAGALRSSDPLQPRGAAVWRDVAQEHALTRVRLGFDIDELVHEFIVLRHVIFDVARERLRTFEATQTGHISDLIEAAIATSVRSYVDARDYQARQREAEHISFVTHELRNPLSAVKLAAHRLRRDAPPESHAHMHDILERNVNRLEGLIDSVLKVERLEVGKIQPHVTELELGELVDKPIATATMLAEAKGLELTAQYDPHLPVCADRELAMSAIQNVVDNAVKFTDEGEVRVVAETAPDRVVLHVWDNCPGMSADELQVIFEPFERGRQSEKPGSGLGLAIARRTLEAQRGSIGAESPGERGCHFWLALPRARH